MTIEITLNNGLKFTADIADFNSTNFAAQLNDPKTLFIALGNNGFTKHAIVSWVEVAEEPAV